MGKMVRTDFFQIGGDFKGKQGDQVIFRYVGADRTVDLSRNADAAIKARDWKKADVDYSKGKLSPSRLFQDESGNYWSAKLFVSTDYFVHHPDVPMPSAVWGLPVYMFQEAFYHDDSTKTYIRYLGFHAQIIHKGYHGASNEPDQIRVRSGGQLNHDGTWFVPFSEIVLSIDFDAAIKARKFDQRVPDGLTEIGVGSGEQLEGALFIEASEAETLGLRTIKIPKTD